MAVFYFILCAMNLISFIGKIIAKDDFDNVCNSLIIAIFFFGFGLEEVLEDKPQEYRAKEVSEIQIDTVKTINNSKDTSTVYMVRYIGIKD